MKNLPRVIRCKNHNIVIHSHNDQYKIYLYRSRKNAPGDYIAESDWRSSKHGAFVSLKRKLFQSVHYHTRNGVIFAFVGPYVFRFIEWESSSLYRSSVYSVKRETKDHTHREISSTLAINSAMFRERL